MSTYKVRNNLIIKNHTKEFKEFIRKIDRMFQKLRQQMGMENKKND